MKNLFLTMNNQQPIGVFDSGLGGLTVLRALKKQLPRESFIYIGDTAHVPYGNKSEQSIINYSKTLSNFLINKYNVKMIVIACNTASAFTLNILQQAFKVPILDVISPMETILINSNNIKRIGIIGTYNTIDSQSYNRLLLKNNSTLQIFTQACPLFVPIIEEGLENHPIAKLISEEYLQNLILENIELLVLGCTHYPIMETTIRRCLPQFVDIIDSAEILAQYVKKYLQTNHLLSVSLSKSSNTQIMVTDFNQKFSAFANKILQTQKYKISTIKLF